MERECFVTIDFDGVCVEDDYPAIGRDIGADPYLRAAIVLGAKLILNTHRGDEANSSGSRTTLMDAQRWLKGHGVAVWAVNINPMQSEWWEGPKLFRHIDIDLANLGTAVIAKHRQRPVVDWDEAGPALLRKVAGILNQ